MNTPFSEWLTLLAQAQKGPVTLPPAVRGHAYSLPIRIYGSWLTATISGSVKASPDAPSELATFTLGEPTYADGYTTFLATLTGVQTAALPPDGDGDGVETLVYDFLLNGERLFGGIFSLSGFVTEAA